MFVPDCALLARRLLGDARVPRRAKVALLLASLVSPIDIVPDFIPLVGQFDDAFLVAIVVAYVVRVSGEDVVAELWPGAERGLSVVTALARR